MDLNLVWQIITVVVGAIVAFAIVKQKVTQHDEKFTSMHEDLKTSFAQRDDTVRKCFEKTDKLAEEIAILKEGLATRITYKEVADDYITRRELELKLQVIETVTTNINREVARMEKQMLEVLDILRDLKRGN